MGEASEGEAPRKRGRPPGSKSKRGTAKPGRRPKPPAKRGRGRPPKAEQPTPLKRIPLMLPPPSAFPAEIILPNGDRFFDGPPTPDDEEVRAANRGGGGAKEPPRNGSGAGEAEDEQPLTRGRKPHLTFDEPTLKMIQFCASRRFTQPEAASVLGVSHKTFQRFLEAHEIARNIWDDGQLRAVASLRAKRYEEAMNGNTSVLVQMAKSWLGEAEGQNPELLEPPDDSAEVEKINQGGRAKRIVVELIEPPKRTDARPNVDPQN